LYITTKFFLLFILFPKVGMCLTKQPSLLTRKKLPFEIVNPQNLKRDWVHLIKYRSRDVLLTPPTQTPFLLRASPEKCKRKVTDDEEYSGASKLSEPPAEESSHEETIEFDPFGATAVISS
jgi:hypothetical protein